MGALAAPDFCVSHDGKQGESMNLEFKGKVEHVGNIHGKAHWQTILEKWINVSKNYCELHPGDLPFWYTERSDLSQLAGAVWKTGGHALEEFSAVKGWGRSYRKGRIDLYFKFNDGFCCTVESKKCWRNAISSVSKKLDEAKKDAIESRKSAGTKTAIALVFQAPLCNKTLSYEEKIDNIMKKNEEIMKNLKPDIFAWFAELRQEYRGGKNKDELYFVGRIIGKRING